MLGMKGRSGGLEKEMELVVWGSYGEGRAV